MAHEKKTTKKTEVPDQKPQEVQAEKALAEKQSTALAAPMDNEWGLDEVSSMDIIIPKLLIMQSPSKLVQQEKAQFGDIVNSVSGEILGTAREKDKKPVRFIPIRQEETWTIFEMVGSKPEFRGQEKRTPMNNNLEREYEKDGKKFKRFQTLSYFVLLVDDLESSDMPMPYVLSFRSTSFKAGRTLSTHFFNCRAAKKMGKSVPPPSTIFELSGTKESNDKGTFYVLSVTPVGSTPEKYMGIAAQWFKTLQTQSYKIDESDEVAEVGATEVDVTVNIKPGEVQEGAQF